MTEGIWKDWGKTWKFHLCKQEKWWHKGSPLGGRYEFCHKCLKVNENVGIYIG